MAVPPMYDISIIIPTYQRPDLLDKAIRSCVNQNNSLGLNYELVVVDNSPDSSAQVLVERWINDAPIPILYVSEPRPNIALARNAGLAHSQAPMVAFIDDDQEAAPDWLDQIVAAQRQFDADAVFGVVLPNFETKSPPPWNRVAKLFVRRYSLPTGAPLPHGSTGNSLVRTDMARSRPGPFDPAFGQTGSEDRDFYLHVKKSGGKLIWCGEAVTYEFVSKERAKVGYMLRRNYRESQGWVRFHVRHSDRPLLTALHLMCRGLAQAGLWLVPAILLAPFTFPFAVRTKLNVVRGGGKIFWMKWFRLQFYKSSATSVGL